MVDVDELLKGIWVGRATGKMVAVEAVAVGRVLVQDLHPNTLKPKGAPYWGSLTAFQRNFCRRKDLP